LVRQEPGPIAVLVGALCNSTICDGANSGILSYNSVGVGVFGIHQEDSRDPYRYGPIHIHEHTHAMQGSHWIGDKHPQEGANRNSPC